MEFPDDLLYTSDDEWLRRDGDEVTVGITDYAQDRLGDIVFLELPATGTQVTAGEPFGAIESVKALSDLNSAVSGEVVATNGALVDAPEVVNSSPYEQGWLVRVHLADTGQLDALMSASEYRSQLPED